MIKNNSRRGFTFLYVYLFLSFVCFRYAESFGRRIQCYGKSRDFRNSDYSICKTKTYSQRSPDYLSRLQSSPLLASSSKFTTGISVLDNAFGYLLSFSKAKFTTTENASTTIRSKIAIIGSGISGLSAAIELLRQGQSDFVIIEASDEVGGRIRSDNVEGFILDRGFQVFIDSYPESQEILDYGSLTLCPFLPGALIRLDGKFHLVSDPLRRPQDLIASLLSPIGTLDDKVKVGLYSICARFANVDDIFKRAEMFTSIFLKSKLGISSSMINSFFKPFFQGIFLSSLNVQSSIMFEFVYKMFTIGSATLPALGIGAITKQLASKIPNEKIYLNTRVSAVLDGGKVLNSVSQSANGTEAIRFECEKVIVATDPPEFKKLLREVAQAQANDKNSKPMLISDDDIDIPEPRSSLCLYYAIDGPAPISDPILLLNGENDLDNARQQNQYTINNVCFPSQVSPSYAPKGKSLCSVTVVIPPSRVNDVFDDVEVESQVKRQLLDWWGEQVNDWTFLKQYRIAYAQPAQTPPSITMERAVTLSDHIFACGDHRSNPTVNGAIASGRNAAAAVVSQLAS